MRLRPGLTVASLIGLAGTSGTTSGQPLLDCHGEARKMAMGGERGRDLDWLATGAED
jgi:hypothetical protein